MFCERGADYVPVYALPRTWDGKDKKEESAMAVLAIGKIAVGNATEKRSYFADSGR